MDSSTNPFAVFNLLIAVYLLVCAATGKGKLYENDRLKVPRERYVKVMRIMAAATGVLLALSTGLSLLGLVPASSPLGWLLWAAGFGCILAMAVYSAKSTARGPVSSEPGKDPLRAAFVFDEEEQTGE